MIIISVTHIIAGLFGFGIGMLISFYTMKKKNEKNK